MYVITFSLRETHCQLYGQCPPELGLIEKAGQTLFVEKGQRFEFLCHSAPHQLGWGGSFRFFARRMIKTSAPITAADVLPHSSERVRPRWPPALPFHTMPSRQCGIEHCVRTWQRPGPGWNGNLSELAQKSKRNTPFDVSSFRSVACSGQLQGKDLNKEKLHTDSF